MTPAELRDLSAFLAINIMRWKEERFNNHAVWVDEKKNIVCLQDAWTPPTNIAQAFEVVEKLRTTLFKWFEMAHRPAGFTCNFVGDPHYTEFAETAELAICLAAKKAVEGK